MLTRERILVEAMALFGTQGYTATTIAQIEQAAGLSPGSGGLYRHFRSKADILAAGVRERIAARDRLVDLFDAPVDAGARRAVLIEVIRAGLERLDAERDLSRVLVRDLGAFPDLLEEFRVNELNRNHEAVCVLLARLDAADSAPSNWAPVATIVIDALSHYWLLADVFGGGHPTGVAKDDYIDALADLVSALLERTTS